MYEVVVRYQWGWKRVAWKATYAAAEASRKRWAKRGLFAIVAGGKK